MSALQQAIRDVFKALCAVSGETKPCGSGKIKRPAGWPPPPEANGAFTTRLEHLEREAQDTLDDYLFSLADPAILTPLRAARDAAREAHARWQVKEVP